MFVRCGKYIFIILVALSLDISLNILHMSSEIEYLAGGLFSISSLFLVMIF